MVFVTTIGQKFLLGLIRVYRGAFFLFSRLSLWWVPPECQFYPSCSRYSQEAIKSLGPWKGGWRSLKRLIKCHPGGKRTVDFPVPPPDFDGPTSCSKNV